MRNGAMTWEKDGECRGGLKYLVSSGCARVEQKQASPANGAHGLESAHRSALAGADRYFSADHQDAVDMAIYTVHSHKVSDNRDGSYMIFS